MTAAAFRQFGPTIAMTNVSLKSTVRANVMALPPTTPVASVKDPDPHIHAGMAPRSAMPPSVIPRLCTDARIRLPATTMTWPPSMMAPATLPLGPMTAMTNVSLRSTVLVNVAALPPTIHAVNVMAPGLQSPAGTALPFVTLPLAHPSLYTGVRTPLRVTTTVLPQVMMEAARTPLGPMTAMTNVSPRSTVQAYVAALPPTIHAVNVRDPDLHTPAGMVLLSVTLPLAHPSPSTAVRTRPRATTMGPPHMMTAVVPMHHGPTTATGVPPASTVQAYVADPRPTTPAVNVEARDPHTAVGMDLRSVTHRLVPLNPYTDARIHLHATTTVRPQAMMEAVPIPMPAVNAADPAPPSAAGMVLPSVTLPLVLQNPYTDARTHLPATTTAPPHTMMEAAPIPMPAVNAADPALQSVVGMVLPSVTHPLVPLNPSTDARTHLHATMTVPPHTMMEAAPMHHGHMTAVVHVSPRSTVQAYVAVLRSMTHAVTVEEVAPPSSA